MSLTYFLNDLEMVPVAPIIIIIIIIMSYEETSSVLYVFGVSIKKRS